MTEIAALRAALAQTQQALQEAQRLLREQGRVFQAMEDLARAGYWWRTLNGLMTSKAAVASCQKTGRRFSER